MEKPKKSGSKRKAVGTASARSSSSRKPASSAPQPAAPPPPTPVAKPAPTAVPQVPTAGVKPPSRAASPAAASRAPAASEPKTTPKTAAAKTAPKTAAKSPAAPPRRTPPAPAEPVAPPPAILLEGDVAPTSLPTGPGNRYVLGPAGIPASPGASPQLPAAYGTRRLLLVARDPHWLYAHWDLTDDQRREYNRRSVDGHLVLRIHRGTAEGEVLLEQDVHPESASWFVHVPDAGARYAGELGYVGPGRVWNRISVSSSTVTPAESLSSETWTRFETLPFEVSMPQLVQLVREAAREHAPLLEAIRDLRASGHPGLPPVTAGRPEAAWTPAQEKALAAVINLDEVRRVWIGSLEITELLRRQLLQGLSSMEHARAAAGAAAREAAPSSLSSPFGGAQPASRGFWFNVNAEVIVYGATEPSATVRIGGRTIALRPDGSFSFRFALPDGSYPLPITATSADAVETRAAELRFQRESRYTGQVDRHPQDPGLRPPKPEHTR